jgi:hypothetical protein
MGGAVPAADGHVVAVRRKGDGPDRLPAPAGRAALLARLQVPRLPPPYIRPTPRLRLSAGNG